MLREEYWSATAAPGKGSAWSIPCAGRCARGALAIGLAAVLATGCAVPKSLQTPFEVGQYEEQLERQRAGLEIDQAAVDHLPEMTGAEYERLGDQYYSQGKDALAFVKYDRAVEVEPERLDARYKAAMIMLKQRSMVDARARMEALIAEYPDYPMGHQGLGLLLLRERKHDQALAEFERALAIEPRLWKSHESIGVIHDAAGRRDEALRAYEKALALAPDQPSLLNNLGVSLFLSGDYERATRVLERACTVSADVAPRTYNNLGRTYAKQGRYIEALEAFRQGGTPASAYNNLGMIYVEEGRTRDALACFREAVAASPTHYPKATANLASAERALRNAGQPVGAGSGERCP